MPYLLIFYEQNIEGARSLCPRQIVLELPCDLSSLLFSIRGIFVVVLLIFSLIVSKQLLTTNHNHYYVDKGRSLILYVFCFYLCHYLCHG